MREGDGQLAVQPKMREVAICPERVTLAILGTGKATGQGRLCEEHVRLATPAHGLKTGARTTRDELGWTGRSRLPSALCPLSGDFEKAQAHL